MPTFYEECNTVSAESFSFNEILMSDLSTIPIGIEIHFDSGTILVSSTTPVGIYNILVVGSLMNGQIAVIE